MKLIDSLFKIHETKSTDDGFSTEMSPIMDSCIYKAHFPGFTITPGACLIRIVGELVGQHVGYDVVLSAIKNVKFLNVVIPAENMKLFVEVKVDSQLKVQAVVRDESSVFTKMSLQYSSK